MNDTTGLIKAVCDGDMPFSMFRKVLTIEEAVMAYQEYERSALYASARNAIHDAEAAQ